MYITKEPTFKYKYGFGFYYSLEILNFCRSLKMKYGYNNFGYEDRKWRFNDLAFVDIIIKRFPEVEIDSNILKDLHEYRIQRKRIIKKAKRAEELKKAITSNIEIPKIKGELYPYQKIGVEFLINNNGKAILADQMGLGKSVESLAYILHTKKKKTLVICPASVKYVWEGEIEKFTDLKSFVIDAKMELSDISVDQHDIIIVNYDILRKFYHLLLKTQFDCVICDEFHYIKNIRAKRTRLAMMLAKKIPSVLLLSGTPLLSRPIELFNGLNLMDPFKWNNWKKYSIRYCNGRQGYWGWEARGATNIDELRSKINRYFLRRTKDEVLKELPPKRFIDYPVKLDNGTWEKYQLAEKSFIEYLRNVKKKKIRQLDVQALKLVKLNELRQICTHGKVSVAKEIIQGIVDSGEKTIVYSMYNKPLKDLHNEFKDISVLLLGSTPTIERKQIVEEFQNNADIKIFFGGTKSAGIGITLTAASNVLFLDYSWVPSDHKQAEDRAHRIGQKAESITIYQLFSKNTIDEKMKSILGEKQRLFDRLIEKEGIPTQKEVSLLGGMLRLFERKSIKDLTSEKQGV